MMGSCVYFSKARARGTPPAKDHVEKLFTTLLMAGDRAKGDRRRLKMPMKSCLGKKDHRSSFFC